MQEEVKYSVGELLSFAFTLVVIGIGVAYGLDVINDVGDDWVTGTNGVGANPGCNATNKLACNTEYNATADSVEAVSNITEKLPTIATVVVASVIIGILLTYLYARFAKM